MWLERDKLGRILNDRGVEIVGGIYSVFLHLVLSSLRLMEMPVKNRLIKS
ncbi:hypothetical protein NVIE_019150 [Nitrososphaera viennensis EN76]|uniref:Uncharacterized protein n=1 Tax=Nitrososphaera viennensis EN76 TaxID=926571 RepID=A0A060HL02_9ARCH|nr:hypothetical protein NVIE_019150 [Nitrososphaera viennensis EN76]